MNLWAMAEHAVLNKGVWDDLALPVGEDADRDDAWRQQLAEDCLALKIYFSGQEEAEAIAAAARSPEVVE